MACDLCACQGGIRQQQLLICICNHMRAKVSFTTLYTLADRRYI